MVCCDGGFSSGLVFQKPIVCPLETLKLIISVDFFKKSNVKARDIKKLIVAIKLNLKIVEALHNQVQNVKT